MFVGGRGWAPTRFFVAPLSERTRLPAVGVTPSVVFPLFGTNGPAAILASVWCVALLGTVAPGYRAARFRTASGAA